MPSETTRNMPSRKVPLTFTFRRNGAHPPLFVAGSFSDPPWQPLEMDASIDQHGDLIFTKQVMVNECSEVQYKFRHASGDWWALDPDAETVTDEHGNVNSLMLSPSEYATQETTLGKKINGSNIQDEAGPRTFDILDDAETTSSDGSVGKGPTEIGSPEEAVEQDELRRLSFTPIEEVANTAAEVADSASQLDDDDLEVGDSDTLPMFSHECFASISNSPTTSLPELEPQERKPDHCSGDANQLNMDYDDPRLEHFPSDRSSILATMRRLSTTIDPEPTMVDTVPLSPITTANCCSSSGPSPRNPLGPEDTNSTQKQTGDAGRYPKSIIARTHSLLSIAESEEITDGAETPDGVEKLHTPTEYIGPVERRNFSLASCGSSNEDEGVAMGSLSPKCKATAIRLREPEHEVIPAVTVDKTTPSEIHSDEQYRSFISNSANTSEPDDDQSRLQNPTNGERPHSPFPAISIHDDDKGYWLRTFLRTMFVDWIGGFVYWLCSRSRNKVVRFPRASGTGAVIVLGAGISFWALQDRLPSIGPPASVGMHG